MDDLEKTNEQLLRELAELRSRVGLMEASEADRKRAAGTLCTSEEWFRLLADRAYDWVYWLGPDGKFGYVSPSCQRITGYSADEFLADSGLLERIIHPDDREAVLGHLRGELERPEPIFLQFRVISRAGGERWIEHTCQPMYGVDARFAGRLASNRDITDRWQRQKRVARLNDWKEQLLGPGDLRERLKLLTDGVVELLGADFARIWVIHEADLCESGCLHAMVAEGPDVCRDRTRCLHLVVSSGRYTRVDGSHRRVPLGCYKIGRVASGEDAKFITNDVIHDRRVHDHQWAESLGLVSFAGYRLLSPEGKPLGVLAMFSRRSIDAGEEALLEDLANAASQTIRAGLAEESIRKARDELEIRVQQRTAELTAQSAELRQEIASRKRAEEALQREYHTLKQLLQSSDHERQVIAYEVHDGLAQYQAGAIIQFQIYDHQKETRPRDAARAFDAGMTMLHQSHFEARRLISGVRPPILDEAGIVAAIAHLVNEQRRQKGPKVEFLSEVEFERLSPILENAVYRIVQESLANACRHSKSKKVRVELVQHDEQLRIEIRDSGVGFSPQDVEEGRFGLAGIRERARLLGGKSGIESEPGKGTRIVVELPIVVRQEDGTP